MTRTHKRWAEFALACVLGVLASTGTASAATCAPTERAGQWPSYGRDLSNQRNQPAETTIGRTNVKSLRPAWALPASAGGGSGGFQSTVVQSRGCVVATTITGSVYVTNADTGEVLWTKNLVANPGSYFGGVFAPSVVGDTVYISVGLVAAPYVVALDLATGEELWRTILYHQVLDGETGTFATSASMVAFDGMLFVTGGTFESNSTSHTSFYILDQRDGRVLKKTVVIPYEEWVQISARTDENPVAFGAGGSMWATAAVDQGTKHLYIGTGSPKNHRRDHPFTNAILKIDVDPSHATFGEIVDSYKGDHDYDAEAFNSTECRYLGEAQVIWFGIFCGMQDIDFGASPNLFTDGQGRTVVSALQKSCTFHAVDTATMDGTWKRSRLGPRPSGFDGCASTAAYAGNTLYVPINDGRLHAFNATTGGKLWATQYGEEDVYYTPPTVANGVVYLLGRDGRLYAFDSATGSILLDTELADPAGVVKCAAGAGGGVTVANNTVYVACDSSTEGDGAVFAYRLPTWN